MLSYTLSRWRELVLHYLIHLVNVEDDGTKSDC